MTELCVEELFPQTVYKVKGFLTPAECAALIERAETAGFSTAALGDDNTTNVVADSDIGETATSSASDAMTSNAKVRNHDRCVLSDTELAAEWWSRVSSLVPQ